MVIVVRFPDGSKEFRSPERMLEEGDVVWHEGVRFRVLSVTDGHDGKSPVAIVEPESTSLADVLQSEEGAVHLTPA